MAAWEQEYWDNTGYHAYFRGAGRADGSFVLDQVRGGGLDAGPRRLRWHAITPDAFLWDYELSTDGGRTWQSTWRIEYSRRT